MKKITFILFSVLFCMTLCAQNKENLINQSSKEYAIIKNILENKIYFVDRQDSIENLSWNSHPSFKGVYLKPLIQGKDINNQISVFLVKIDAGCILETHVHENKLEIHQVLEGNGIFYLNDQKLEYKKGNFSLIPENTPHKVIAGENGLYLLATFSPA